MQKKQVIFGSIFSLAVFLLTGCQPLSSAGNTLIQIGNLSFWEISSGGAVVGLLRLLLWVLIFTILFALISSASGSTKALGFLKKNHAIVIAFVVATISAIFLSPEVLLATGAGWGTVVALVLIGVPVLAVAYLLWEIPGNDSSGKPLPETKWTVLLKLMLCLLLFWVLTAMRYYVGTLGGGGQTV
ncbi:hypothetical protein HYX13_03885 [Candidatus Woesearchaeota archaeon]|nr:hypothetical protein [Candidatus Woesearchaeota archaeon]